jgi:hypothetical protein
MPLPSKREDPPCQECEYERRKTEVTEAAMVKAVELALELYDQYYRMREMQNVE